MHRWLLNLNPWEAIFHAPDEGAGSGSAAGDGGGGSPAPSAPDSAPAASPSSDSGSSTPTPDGGAAPASRTPPKISGSTAKEPKAASQSFDFMDYDEDPNLQPVVEAPPVVQAEAPAPEPAPVAPPPVQQPVAPTPAPSPQGTPQQGENVPSLPSDPGEVLELMKPQLAQMIEHATENYKLSKEEADALETDVVGTLPKLLAKVHMQTALGMLHNLNQFVPKMIQNAMEQDRTRRASLDAFYTATPGLDRNNPAHQEAVQRIGLAYRRANPQASREQAIKDIGMMSLQALGLPLAPPPARGNGRTVSQQPFVPAGAGAAPATSPPPQPYDPFAGMGMDFDE